MKTNKYDPLITNNDAIVLRKQFGEDDFSPIDIFTIIESINDITCIYYPLSDNISGMCIKEKNNKIIVINSNMSIGRQRFTIAHELCHLYYHDDKYYICSKKLSINSIEYEADNFASYFLAPYGSLKSKYKDFLSQNKPINEVIVMLEQYYGMSHQAMLYRLYKENYITNNQYENFKSESPSLVALFLGYDNTLYLPNKNYSYYTSGKYIKLALKALDSNKISESKYEELLLDAFRDDLVYGTNDEGIND